MCSYADPTWLSPRSHRTRRGARDGASANDGASASDGDTPDLSIASLRRLVTEHARVDVCFELGYVRRDGGEAHKVSWCQGTFIGARAATTKTPALLVVSYDDGEVGTLATTNSWNNTVPVGWRWCVEDDDAESDDDDLVDYDGADDDAGSDADSSSSLTDDDE